MNKTLVSMEAKVIVTDFPDKIFNCGCYACFYNGTLFIDKNYQQYANLWCASMSLKEKSASDIGVSEADMR
jgi:hypothetical protein